MMSARARARGIPVAHGLFGEDEHYNRMAANRVIKDAMEDAARDMRERCRVIVCSDPNDALEADINSLPLLPDDLEDYR